MIIELTGGGEDGVLVIDDKTSELLIRTNHLPADVVLKVYLAAVRGKKTRGTMTSRKNESTYRWEVLGQHEKKRRAHPSQRPARVA